MDSKDSKLTKKSLVTPRGRVFCGVIIENAVRPPRGSCFRIDFASKPQGKMESDNHVVFWKEYNVTFPASSPDDAREQDCAGELRDEVRLSHHIRRKKQN